jgi:hypothetical protein
MTSLYNKQHLEAFLMVRDHLNASDRSDVDLLEERIGPYLAFREDVTDFQKRHFSGLCNDKCFTNRESACCGREGIVAFFADVVINVLQSHAADIDRIIDVLKHDQGGMNCVYLGDTGCLWRMKPIACEMFLCHDAKRSVLENDRALLRQWEMYREKERRFTWPSGPVLFDWIEGFFIRAGCDSPIMYCHRSPGLLRIKARHGMQGPL